MIPQFKYYLFDVDGTLLDSAGDITTAVREVLSRRGRGQNLTEDDLRSQIGRHLIGTFTEVFPEYSAEQLDELVREYRANYLGRNHKSTRMYPGVSEALATLPGKKSTATTKGSPTTGKVLELFGIRHHFDHVQGTDGFPCKPEPDVIFRGLAALGGAPEECLMVGDAAVDIQAGSRAGVTTCAVRYGYGSAESITAAGPDFVIDDLRELLP